MSLAELFGSKGIYRRREIDEAMRPNLALHGLTMEQVGACRRDSTQYQCYLELHIEQGAERMQIRWYCCRRADPIPDGSYILSRGVADGIASCAIA